MSSATTKIKSRIKSVSNAYKVTSAMKLVSTVKLKKYRNKMLTFRAFSDEVNQAVDELLCHLEKVKTPFNEENEKAGKKLYIVVGSTLGLCGSYNNNIFKLADVSISKEDEAVLLGEKVVLHFANGTFKKLDQFSKYTNSDDSGFIKMLANYIIDSFISEKYQSVHMIYSYYKNPIAFIPKDITILPIRKVDEKADHGYGPILEPDGETLVASLIPFYIQTTLHSKLLESEVCEQGARSNAMENATNNAKDLLDNLQIEFNKARQGAITQEIIEIVGASRS